MIKDLRIVHLVFKKSRILGVVRASEHNLVAVAIVKVELKKFTNLIPSSILLVTGIHEIEKELPTVEAAYKIFEYGHFVDNSCFAKCLSEAAEVGIDSGNDLGRCQMR